MKFYLLMFILFLHLVSFADNLSGIDPAYYDYDVKLSAMGNAGAAIVLDSPSATLSNPASLANQKSPYIIQFANSNYLNLITYNYAGFSYKHSKGSVFSLAADFAGDEIMDEYELILSWACPGNTLHRSSPFLNNLNLGFNLKLLGSSFGNNDNGAYYDENGLNHQIKGNSYGFAIDYGIQYHPTDTHRFAIFNRNVLSMIFWNSTNQVGTAKGKYNESRPISLILAYAYQNRAATLCLDYDVSLYDDRDSYLHSGIEFKLFKDILFIRSGVCHRAYSLETIHYNMGCGINFKIAQKIIQFDIAYRIFPAWQGSNNLLFGILTKL